MAIWKLEPTNLESPDWQISTNRGRVIVRAPDAMSARKVAAEHFTRGARPVVIGQDSPASPWTNPELVTCTELADSDFDPDGPAEVLGPLSWEPEALRVEHSRVAMGPPSAQEAADETKFPCGLVPTALPAKRMGGRVRTRRR